MHDSESTVDNRPSSSPFQLDPISVRESIVVAVNGGSSGWQALDWAAAEAATRGSPLRIVYVIVPPMMTFEPLIGAGLVWADVHAPPVGAWILEDAARRAHLVAPDSTVTTHLEAGYLASTIREASRYDAMTVVGRGRPRRFGFPSPGRRIARRSDGPVAIVELGDQCWAGPSAGRVVLGIDGTAKSSSAIAYAFQAASRRGVGITVVHACTPQMKPRRPRAENGRSFEKVRRFAALDDVLQPYRDANPDVDVRSRFVAGSARSALVAESEGAALLVIGGTRRGPRHLAMFDSIARTMFRQVHSPVAIIRPKVSSRRWMR